MIYLHYKSPAHIYPPEPGDIYLYLASGKQPSCGYASMCNICPLSRADFNCGPTVINLLTLYPNPTILTPDTHPEIFL